MTECLVEAGIVLRGMGTDGRFVIDTDAAILVRDGKVVEIGDAQRLKSAYPALPRFGGPGMIAMPGMTNSHHHSGVTPLMHGVPFAPLELWLPQFRALRPIPTKLDTLYSAIEMLESGTTSVQHIHGGVAGAPAAWRAEADDVLGAYGEIGMRAGFCFMIRDQHILGYGDDAEILAQLPATEAGLLKAQLDAAMIPIGELMGFFHDLRAAYGGRNDVRINLAPANLHWCSDAALEEIFGTARANGAQIHMHLVETERQANDAEARFGHSAIAHLHQLGCLGDNVTFGHGNWNNRADLELLADHGCCACHNASSGLRLASGIAPVNPMLGLGIPVALGIDQSNYNDDRDMLAEIKLVWALHRETGMFNPRPDAAKVLQMATENGARTAGFGSLTGRLEPGRAADIVLLDRVKVERPFVDRRTPIEETILHRAKSGAVEQVLVGGELVVDGGRVTRIDREAVMAEIAARLAAAPTPAELQARQMVAALMQVLEATHRRETPDTYRSYRYNRMHD
jgi:5-methylthioadenosine/S-adenosylhomocysteine deaminase